MLLHDYKIVPTYYVIYNEGVLFIAVIKLNVSYITTETPARSESSNESSFNKVSLRHMTIGSVLMRASLVKRINKSDYNTSQTAEICVW
jgi:hypothetical protein